MMSGMDAVMIPESLSVPLLTVPTAAHKCGAALDRFRTALRRREPELLALGIVIRVGPHRLVRGDKLDDLLRILGGADRG